VYLFPPVTFVTAREARAGGRAAVAERRRQGACGGGAAGCSAPARLPPRSLRAAGAEFVRFLNAAEIV